MIYTVHNKETNEQLHLSEEQLENAFPELQLGILEIVDEIDDRPFTIPYHQAQSLNQCMASLWELVAYSKPPFTEDGTALTHQELIQSLEAILPQMDQALTVVA